MITEMLLMIIMMFVNFILRIVFGMGQAVFSLIDLVTRGSFSATIPYLDAFVDVNVLRGSIGTILTVYSTFWGAFITNWIIKRIRGG